MTPQSLDTDAMDATAAWWATSISQIQPNSITLQGYTIEDLILRVSFVESVWLLTRGEIPSEGNARLLEAAMVASLDHGPHAPSIAIARMTATCGVGINNAIASGTNALGDVHGGAGQQCLEMLSSLIDASEHDGDIDRTAHSYVSDARENNKRVPGYGHRFHTRDPRRDPLIGMVEEAVTDGVIGGDYLKAGLALENELSRGDKPIPMNVDGVTAIIYGELGFQPDVARGLFVLSRSVGILAHASEEISRGKRLKGPIPTDIEPTYLGVEKRRLPGRFQNERNRMPPAP